MVLNGRSEPVENTTDLTGEMQDRYFATTRGDSRIAIRISRDEETVKLGRKNRFLVDDPMSPQKLAYELTKPLKFTGVYNGEGIFGFVLQEVVSTDNDNFELGIADYYKHFPKPEHALTQEEIDKLEDNTSIDPENNKEDDTGKAVWL